MSRGAGAHCTGTAPPIPNNAIFTLAIFTLATRHRYSTACCCESANRSVTEWKLILVHGEIYLKAQDCQNSTPSCYREACLFSILLEVQEQEGAGGVTMRVWSALLEKRRDMAFMKHIGGHRCVASRSSRRPAHSSPQYTHTKHQA